MKSANYFYVTKFPYFEFESSKIDVMEKPLIVMMKQTNVKIKSRFITFNILKLAKLLASIVS